MHLLPVDTTPEEKERLRMELCSPDLPTRCMAESRAKFLWDQSARERTSYRDGRKVGHEEGREEGIQENRLSTARILLQENAPFAMIAKVTKYSLAEIERLAKESHPE